MFNFLHCGACHETFFEKEERDRHRNEFHLNEWDLMLTKKWELDVIWIGQFDEHPNEWAIMLSNWKQFRAAVGQQDNHREYLIVGLAFSTFSKKMCIDEVLAKIEIYYCLDTSEKAYDEKSQELIAFVHHNLGRFDDGWSCTRQSTHCLIPFFSRDSYLEHLEREHMKQFIEFLNQYRELRKEVSHIPPTFAHIQFLSEKYGANTSHFVDDDHGIENRACGCVNAQIANQGQMKNEEDETWMDMRDHKETSKIWLPPNDNENEQSVIIIEPHRKRQHCDDVDETLRRSKRNRTQSKRLCVDFNKSYTYEE
ncbi:hypothetical protein PRIPAC_96694 [Pristionchus pacificus]|uniref:C2H2-type domain-containing protein n=1 Tax=Pristionchus pacificus TaxID=54126 RepID=A0A2A6BDR4_PRIPA|nr:hypothetical protein PRIPAC_96694 [Pristionchus pacificus]|eukprot:PDM64014.1 hypothetical protein PRIPAC_49515 [Pristionchus pacificus]